MTKKFVSNLLVALTFALLLFAIVNIESPKWLMVSVIGLFAVNVGQWVNFDSEL